MPAQLVPTIKTSYTNFEIIKGFVEGWKKQFGEFPRKKSIAVLWAQNAIETGSTSSMWNNNVGNVKYSPNKESDDNIQYMMLSNVWEIIGGKKIIFQPPHPSTWFRAFPTLADGVAFHLDFLKNKRYKKAWSAIEIGSPSEFAHLLKLANYYTAPESDYVRAVAMYFNKFMKDDTFEKVIGNLVAPEPSIIIEHVESPVIEITTTPQKEQPIVISEPVPTIVPVQNSFWESIIKFLSSLFTKM